MEKLRKNTMMITVGVVILLLIMVMMCFALKSSKDVAQAATNNEEEYSYYAGVEDEEDRSFLSSYILLQKNIVELGEPLTIELCVTSEKQSYTYNTKGISVVGEQKNKNSTQIEILTETNEGQIDVFVDNGDGTSTRNNVYTCVESDKVFTSIYSIEEARFNVIQYKYEIGEISEKEYQNQNAVFSRRGIKEEIIIRDPKQSEKNADNTKGTNEDKTTYVAGTLYWTTQDGYERPLSNMRVDLFDYDPLNNDDLLGITYTDLNGNYSFSFQNDDSLADLYGCDVYIRMYPDGRTFEIGKNWDTACYYYYCDSPTVDNVATGSTTYFNRIVLFDPNNSHNNAFYMAQGLIVGEKYIRDMLGYYPSDVVKVWFPLLPPEINQFISWINNTFNASISTITEPQTAFCYGTLMGVSSHYRYDWDTILHEYGHYVEHQMDTYNISILQHLIYNPTHGFNDDDVDAHTLLWSLTNITCKEYGLNLAWTEAWASAFSLVAQDYYNNNILDITNVRDVADVFEGSWDCENKSVFMKGGEANEWAIASLLWDLYDSNSDTADSISMGASLWWEATTVGGTYRLSDFASTLNNDYGIYRNAIGILMEYYDFGPSSVNINGITPGQTLSSSTSIDVSWTPNGRPSSPNNQFAIAVYNNVGTQLWISDIITANSHIITSSELSSIRSSIGRNITTLNIAVLGYNSDAPETGSYQSAIWSISVKNPLDISSGDRYTEFTDTSLAGIWQEFFVRFEKGGTKIIQTFGAKDTRMEIYNSSNTLIGSDNDSGYSKNALLSLNAAQNEVYKIRVRFKSFFTVGSFKVSIISASAVSNYEAIGSLSSSVPSITVTAPSNLSRIFTYSSTTTASHRIFTAKASSSSIFTNTVLYIVDPRSADAGYLYNDNGGSGLYSSITRTFDAGVPYLIIASKFTLSSNRTFLLCNE